MNRTRKCRCARPGISKPQTEVGEMGTSALTVSPYEAAARLGLGRRTIYRLIEGGRLPVVGAGKRPPRIPVSAIEAALAEPERLNLGNEEAKK